MTVFQSLRSSREFAKTGCKGNEGGKKGGGEGGGKTRQSVFRNFRHRQGVSSYGSTTVPCTLLGLHQGAVFLPLCGDIMAWFHVAEGPRGEGGVVGCGHSVILAF